MFAYVGSRTTKERNARGEGISVFRLDPTAGTLELVDVTRGLINPSFLALSRDGRFLYTVHGDQSEISAFSVDAASGRLTFVNRQSTGGQNPVHLAFDAEGEFIVVTNHIGASLAVIPVASDGSLKPLSQLVNVSGPIGPHRVEQKQAKPHFNLFDPAGRFVIVPDKGLDRTFSYRFVDGQLRTAAPPFSLSREGSGPRHAAFHPARPFAYLINELDSTVTAYSYDDLTGALRPFQILSSLPDTFTGNSRASEIEVDRKGRYLYASNRGADSIAVFEIDSGTGRLRFIEATPSLGRTPRFFALTPDNRFLFALNEDSDSIVGFRVAPENGQLAPSGFTIASGSPVCMVFLK
ncbi:6-phosphogluconolactonase, cycloisomerase 2 family [Burkholderia sp. CF099]|nr:6-phosphogluconolactonase, cycloisomerase 2 family [Burkholderia sp. CF099]